MQGANSDSNIPNDQGLIDQDSTRWETINDDVLPKFGKLAVALVNQDEELKQKSRFLGENRLAEDLNKRRGLMKFIDHIWKGGIARSFYRQRHINESRRDLLAAESIVLDNNEKERRAYNRSVCSAFVSDVEGAIDESAGDKRESLLANHPRLHAQIKSIVEQYASGAISDTEDANRQFNDAIENFANNNDFDYGEGHFSISNIRDVAIEAKKRYEDLMTITEAVGNKMEHDDAMQRVMAGFDVLYGNRQMDRLEPKYSKVDSIIDKINSSKVGCLVSPETVSLAAGAAMSVGEFLGKRLANSVLVAIPGLSGAIMGGLQAGTTFERERFRAKFDIRYGREFDQDKRRNEVMGTLQTHYSASTLMSDLKDRVVELNSMINRGEDISNKRDELMNLVANVKGYLDLEKTGKPVVSYTSEFDAPSEQLNLLISFAKAKEFLSNNGIADIDAKLDKSSNLMQSVFDSLEQNAADADKRAKNLKAWRIAKKAGLGLVSGAAIGLVMQEVSAFFNPNVKGIFEDDSNYDYTTRLTAGKKLANLIRGKKPTIVESKTSRFTAHADLNNSSLVDNSNAFSFQKSPDGTYMLMKNGKKVAEGIAWDSSTGEMTNQSIKLLKSQGINVAKTSNGLTQTIQTPVTSTKTIRTTFGDYLKQNVNRVKRAFWYDNDTPGVFDKNELRCHYYTDPATGRHGLITGMTDSGSYHGNNQAIFSDLAKGGKIKLLISATKDTQSTPIEVTGKLLPDGQLSFVPEDGSFAAQFFDENGKFIGKFAEVVQDLGKSEDGADVIAPLATVVGDGLVPKDIFSTETVSEIVNRSITVPNYIFSVAEKSIKTLDPANTFPMLFPVVPDGAMNASRLGRFTRRRRPVSDHRGYGYGYGYGYGRNYNSNSRPYNSPSNFGGHTPLRSNDSIVDTFNSLNTEIIERPLGEYDDFDYPAAFGNISQNVIQRQELQLGSEVSRYADEVRHERGDDYVNNIKRQVESSRELMSLDNRVKTIVTIPVHAPTEADNIYKTLSFYAQQEGIDMNSMVVLLDLNWREVEPGSREDMERAIEKTRSEIDNARHDFPNLKIATFEQEGHHGIFEVATVMNDVAMAAIDNAIKTGNMDENNDVLIVRNDADVRHMNRHYIASYQNAAEANRKTPLFTGTTWFNIDRTRRTPGFGSVLTIERMNNLFGALDGNIHTAGGNFAYRASHFAAVNGFGFDQDDDWVGAGSDDLKIGYRISDILLRAYNDRVDNSGNPDDHDLMDPSTKLLARVGGATIDTDDTRYLKFYAADNSLVTNDAYNNIPGGYDQSVLRPSDMKDFREYLADPQRVNTMIDQFEREMSNYFTLDGGWSSRLTRIISWWLKAPPEEMFELNETNDYLHNRFRVYNFRLTPQGRERYKQSLIARMGTGTSTDDRNTMQRAVSSGEWLSPIANSRVSTF